MCPLSDEREDICIYSRGGHPRACHRAVQKFVITTVNLLATIELVWFYVNRVLSYLHLDRYRQAPGNFLRLETIARSPSRSCWSRPKVLKVAAALRMETYIGP
jgi:hypothetical protein